MADVPLSPVSRTAISTSLIAGSGLWMVGACEYYAKSGLSGDWSATPLFWMLVVVLAPALCFAGGMILMGQRRQRELVLPEWWALVAAFLPVTLGSLLSVWAVKALFSMSGL